MSQPRLQIVEEVLTASDASLGSFESRAASLTDQYHGTERTFFNPLYVSNVCINDCSYCGYRQSNRAANRATLTPEEVAVEARALGARGVRNILILAGEYSRTHYVEMLLRSIEAVSKTQVADWIGVEVAPLNIDEYARVKAAGAQSVTVFQETYSPTRYLDLHRNAGPKSAFGYRYDALSRAVQAGIREVGLGTLYGVGSWMSDTLRMLEHAATLRDQCPNLHLRFSFPRLMPSECQNDDAQTEIVSPSVLWRIILATRIAYPDASLVLTGRESSEFLLRALAVVNVIGKGGSTAVGGYSVFAGRPNLEQFQLNTDLTFDEFKAAVHRKGYSSK